MSSSILQSITNNIQDAKFFAMMADKCFDVSNQKQLTICLRWVDDSLEVHKDFLCLHNIPDTMADNITAAIKDVLHKINLHLHGCRGQCYDGASSMTGSRQGVPRQILDEEFRALFTHAMDTP